MKTTCFWLVTTFGFTCLPPRDRAPTSTHHRYTQRFISHQPCHLPKITSSQEEKNSHASVVVAVRMDMIVVIVWSIPGRHGHSEHKKRLLSKRLLRESPQTLFSCQQLLRRPLLLIGKRFYMLFLIWSQQIGVDILLI
jgi:hypothetical protein